MKIWQHVRTSLRWIWRYGLALILYGMLIVFMVQRSGTLNDLWHKVAYEVSAHQFDYFGWEVQAILAKAGQTLHGQHPFMSEAARSGFVREYVADLQQLRRLEAEIRQLYTDPAITDADDASAALRQRRDALRETLNQRKLTAEAIIEGQVAAVMVDAGFGTLGQLLPPMAMHMTEVPNLLVTSPRDQIRMDVSVNLYPLPVDEIEAIEARIDERYNVSSLIVPLGGIALYPAMVLEYASIPLLIETFAHEWLHHYLFFFPLGIHYFTVDGFSGAARTINETTADLFGKEITRQVLRRYYPELVTAEAPTAAPEQPAQATTPEPAAFDFGEAMHETRITVDALLNAGEIAAAEAYMAERRELFYANGYAIRKINQAYFAFYGGYQAGGVPGVGGEDPIGPAIRQIREQSTDLHDFIVTMRGITTREALLNTAGP